jgi:hypothetical protein
VSCSASTAVRTTPTLRSGRSTTAAAVVERSFGEGCRWRCGTPSTDNPRAGKVPPKGNDITARECDSVPSERSAASLTSAFKRIDRVRRGNLPIRAGSVGPSTMIRDACDAGRVARRHAVRQGRPGGFPRPGQPPSSPYRPRGSQWGHDHSARRGVISAAHRATRVRAVGLVSAGSSSYPWARRERRELRALPHRLKHAVLAPLRDKVSVTVSNTFLPRSSIAGCRLIRACSRQTLASRAPVGRWLPMTTSGA